MGIFERAGLPRPSECPGMLGVLVSLVGAAGSIWAFLSYGRPIWSFALLALFALLGWTSFIWCVVWEESTPEERISAGFIGLVAGSVGFGVGVIAGFVYGSPTWSYVLIALSALVVAGSLVEWGRSR